MLQGERQFAKDGATPEEAAQGESGAHCTAMPRPRTTSSMWMASDGGHPWCDTTATHVRYVTDLYSVQDFSFRRSLHVGPIMCDLLWTQRRGVACSSSGFRQRQVCSCFKQSHGFPKSEFCRIHVGCIRKSLHSLLHALGWGRALDPQLGKPRLTFRTVPQRPMCRYRHKDPAP